MILPTFYNYMNSSSANYGLNSLCFTDNFGNQFFFSYQTLIAFKIASEDKLVIRENVWNNTTGKHLNVINPDKSIRVNKEVFDKEYQKHFSKGV